MEVLKIATAGSVDDGKSTLIGRLLYETGSLTDDKLKAIKDKSHIKGYDYMDFSLATDGLIAEREQGITIDVAHIYFSFGDRSYIIADTPGHEEYTRNMITGASTSDMSIILVDARKGVLEQTLRHFFITQLLRMNQLIICINKMDLVDYDQNRFEEVKSYINDLKRQYKSESRIQFIPVSALKGDNITDISPNMPWYAGDSMMDMIAQQDKKGNVQAARFPVQGVIRPKQAEFHDYRAYTGKLYGGSLKVGDHIKVFPSEKTALISHIDVFEGSLNEARPGMSISLRLDRDINISRGDLVVKVGEEPQRSKQLSAKLCWMDENHLKLGGIYLLRSGSLELKAKITELASKIDVSSSLEIMLESGSTLGLNEVGRVQLKLNRELAYDTYEKNRVTGRFILIDPKTNSTSGVGFIL